MHVALTTSSLVLLEAMLISMSDWKLLSNHGMALICLARDPGSRLRDVAERVGITERAAHRIVGDLVDAGYLTRERVGARNRYQVQADVPMRHSVLEDHWVGELLAVLAPPKLSSAEGRAGASGSRVASEPEDTPAAAA